MNDNTKKEIRKNKRKYQIKKIQIVNNPDLNAYVPTFPNDTTFPKIQKVI